MEPPNSWEALFAGRCACIFVLCSRCSVGLFAYVGALSIGIPWPCWSEIFFPFFFRIVRVRIREMFS
jgi:hypothetical protein